MIISRKRQFAVYVLIALVSFISLMVGKNYSFSISSDFSYSEDVFSIDNFYDSSKSKYTGEVFSKTTYSYEVVGNENDALLIAHKFDVRKPNGTKIFEVNRIYGIDPVSKQHVVSLGDRKRNGFLFGPGNFSKSNFKYWHINYDNAIEMHFEQEEEIEGLLCFKFSSNFESDQTNGLKHLPGVGVERGVSVDVQLDLWVDPETGWLIKYEDHAVAWFYDLNSKQRIHPWNKFQNSFKKESIVANVDYVEGMQLTKKAYSLFIPLICGGLLIVLVFFRLIKFNIRVRSHLLVPGITLITGAIISFVIFFHEQEASKSELMRKYSWTLNEIIVKIDSELKLNRLAIEKIPKDELRIKTSQYPELAQEARYWLLRSNSLETFFYIPIDPKFSKTEEDFTLSYIFPTTSFSKLNRNGLDKLELLRDVLHKARATEEEVCSFPISWINDSTNLKSILMFDIVRDESKEMIGVFGTSFSVHNFFNAILSSQDLPFDISLSVTDLSRDEGIEVFKNETEIDAEEFVSKRFPAIDRNWEVKLQVPSIQVSTGSIVFLLFGTSFSFLLAYVLFISLSKKSKQVDLVNKNLNERQDDLLQKNNILNAKNKELEQFTHIVSHDLQEPLNTVLSITELLQKDGKELPEDLRSQLKFISDSSHRMSKLISGLLEYSRIGKNTSFQVVDCNLIVEDVLEDLSKLLKDRNVVIEVGALPKLNGFPVELRMLFQNLIINSIKFQRIGWVPVINISAIDQGDYWLLSVRDNGIGIEAKNKEKIFGIFQRLHTRKAFEGSGIGLAHCKKIVSLHFGEIWVDSEYEEGTDMRFTLKKHIVNEAV